MRVFCPECGAPMHLRETTKFPYKNGDPRKFYGCNRFPKCFGVHGAHPDGTPLGIPGDQETKQARVRAHEVFSEWCAQRGFRKKYGYAKLARLLGIEKNQAHFGVFDKAMCEKVITTLETLNV